MVQHDPNPLLLLDIDPSWPLVCTGQSEMNLHTVQNSARRLLRITAATNNVEHHMQ